MVQALVAEAHALFKPNTEGENSQVYPALARAASDLFGVCVAGTSGKIYAAGEADHEFSIMSVSKPFVFALVCQEIGPDQARERLGANATGMPFNSLAAVERSSDGRTNPMVNAGAIATTRSFAYAHRDDDMGVQLPCDTLVRASGSCRDFAVFMMEAARHWGFGARFVTGYIQMAEGQHGATHAWTEIYIPGAGWRGFDPTNNKLAGNEHVSVAVAREQEKACPLSGVWEGPGNAFNNMNVSVKVVSL